MGKITVNPRFVDVKIVVVERAFSCAFVLQSSGSCDVAVQVGLLANGRRKERGWFVSM